MKNNEPNILLLSAFSRVLWCSLTEVFQGAGATLCVFCRGCVDVTRLQSDIISVTPTVLLVSKAARYGLIRQ